MKYYLTVSSVVEVPILATFFIILVLFRYLPPNYFLPVGHDASSHDYFMITNSARFDPYTPTDGASFTLSAELPEPQPTP